LEVLLGGVDVEVVGLAGAEHVAGGVEGAEVDVAARDDGDAGDERAELEREESDEVELEAFLGEKHRGPLRWDGDVGRSIARTCAADWLH